LPSLSRAYKEVSIFVICSHVGKGDWRRRILQKIKVSKG
jgi:hypothetical protein